MVRAPALVEHIVLPFLWQRYLSFLRVLVGAACLWMLLGLNRATWTSVAAIAALVTVYSAVGIFWRVHERIDRSGWLNHILDLIFYLLSIALGGEIGFWVSALAAFSLLLALATLHQWRDVLLGTVIVLGGTHLMRPPYYNQILPVLLLLGMFGVILSLQKRTLLERLSNLLRQSLYYRSTAKKAGIVERERIAADFHDGPMQSFMSFQMRLAILHRIMEKDPEKAMLELEHLQEICSRQVTEIRTFVRNMRAPEVDGAGMAAALRREVTRFNQDTGISANFQADTEASHDDFDASSEVVQIVREALNNVMKHSSASQVTVSLSRVDGSLELKVNDDGRGFDWSGTYSMEQMERLAVGPESILRRVRSMKGQITVLSEPGQGTELSIRVPVN